jgi:predicted enzyme related to lactoylglutathione lyase
MTTTQEEATVLRGFATISYWADDQEAATRWYADLLGIEPYFVRDGYVEFRVGDTQDELGIIDRRFAPPSQPTTPGGVVMHWHVDDIEAAYQDLLDRGATSYQPPTPRGEGFVTAAVVDPFGNVLGIMYNPHYLEMLEAV